jgi:hypothetical protein
LQKTNDVIDAMNVFFFECKYLLHIVTVGFIRMN